MRKIMKLLRDRRGSVAVEFAFVAPVMIALYFGMAEITQALLTDRRVSQVASAVGDLVAQSGSLTTTDVNNVFDVSTSLLRPSSTAPLGIRVTSITIDKDGKATVKWQQTRGDVASLPDALTNIPTALLKPNESLVRADTTYLFTSMVQQALPKPIRFRHTIYLKPRSAAAVERPS